MHINEVRSILSDSFSSGVNAVYELKNYNDHQCCNSDFVLLYNHQEYAYIKFDNTGKMTKEEMGIHEEKMGTAYFYIIVKDTDDFIPTNLVLGPNLPERDLNRQQLLAMINQCQITVSSDFEIILSSINSYRS